MSEFQIDPEPSLIGWIGNSIILMTGSLLIFHMTKTGSLKVHPIPAAFICIGFILVDIAISITSLIPYNTRWTSLDFTKHEMRTYMAESNYRYMYTIIISIFIFIQLFVCYYIIIDSMHLTNKLPKSKRFKYFDIFI